MRFHSVLKSWLFGFDFYVHIFTAQELGFLCNMIPRHVLRLAGLAALHDKGIERKGAPRYIYICMARRTLQKIATQATITRTFK